MKLAVIWIDSKHAKLFHFSDDQMQRESFHVSEHDHHTHVIDREERLDREAIPMFNEIANNLIHDKKILILGPGFTRTQFLAHLQKNYPDIALCVAGCEASDHPTDHQIAARALEFFNLKPLTLRKQAR